jgi:hypothetical protein
MVAAKEIQVSTEKNYAVFSLERILDHELVVIS